MVDTRQRSPESGIDVQRLECPSSASNIWSVQCPRLLDTQTNKANLFLPGSFTAAAEKNYQLGPFRLPIVKESETPNSLQLENQFSMIDTVRLLRISYRIRKSKLIYSPLALSSNPIIKPTSQFNLPPGLTDRTRLLTRRMSDSAKSVSAQTEILKEDEVQQIDFLTGEEDLYGGVTVNVEKSMDSEDFALKLRASMSKWKFEGKKGIWIKLPLALVNLVEPAVKEGFWYHHAEPEYLMLVNWISDDPSTIPANASHRIGVGAFVLNHNSEVLVVQEKTGPFRGKDVWKFPTGVLDQGEDISTAAIREVKEETGIDAEFVEVLAFRHSHKAFFGKSDLLFICMLKPNSLDIQKQDSEIKDAQWMPIEDYVRQPFNQKNEMFGNIARICLKKSLNQYSGLSPVITTTASGKRTYMYCNAISNS